MKRIFVSSLVRIGAMSEFYGVRGDVGKVYLFDIESGSLITNPVDIDISSDGSSLHKVQGKSRGARGLAYYNGHLYVAGSVNVISVYDINTLELVDTLKFNEKHYFHQLRVHNDRLHAISTGTDSILRIKDFVVEEVTFLGDKDAFFSTFLYEGREYNEWGTDRVHFNSIAWDEEGAEYHVYHTLDAVVNYTSNKLIAQGGPLWSPHDVAFHGSDILVNSTAAHSLVAIDRDSGKQRVVFVSDYDGDPSNPDNDWNSTRGLAVFGEYVVVGSVPTRVTLLRRTGSGEYVVENRFDLSLFPYEAVYDILIHPDDL